MRSLVSWTEKPFPLMRTPMTALSSFAGTQKPTQRRERLLDNGSTMVIVSVCRHIRT